jgi:pilus assembly protein CpaE
MAEKIRVMIVDDIAETREQLRKLLSFDPDITVVAMAGSGEEAVAQVVEANPDVVLMDINLPGMDGISATAKLLELVPTVQVVMLSVQGDVDYMRRAMMAGARDFLTKPPSADDLINTIHRMAKLRPRTVVPPSAAAAVAGVAAGGGVPTRSGKIITFFTPKGGTGVTSIAVNTALALQKQIGDSGHVALVDANLQFGDISIFLKLKPTRTIADLAPRIEEMDVELLRTVLVTHPTGLQILAAPAAPEDAEIVRNSGVDDNGGNRALHVILEFMQRQYDYIIVDTAHVVDDVMLALLDLSDLVLLVTRPVIPEIRGVRVFIELLQKMEFDMQRVGLVINAVDNKRMGIQPEAIERAMMPAIARLPLDERTALRAANYGVPYLLQSPKQPLSQAVVELARAIRERFSAAEEKERPATQGGLGRLL